MMLSGQEVVEGTLSGERFAPCAGAAEAVDFKPEEVDLKLEEGNLKLEEGDLKLEEGDLKPEEVDLKLEEGDLKPEKADLKLEEGDLKPEKANLRLDLIIDSVARGTDGSSPAPPPQPPVVVRQVIDFELNKQTGSCGYEVVREENGEDRLSSPPASMWRHYRISTTADGFTSTRWVCAQCGKQLSKPCWLRDHVNTVHVDDFSFQCGECDKLFRTRKTLYQHVRGHLALYVCEVCGRRFQRASVLQQHQRTHTGEFPYACRHCRAAFKQLANLWQHYRHYHGYPLPPGAAHTPDTRQLKYTCLSCQLTLPTLPDLIQHKQTCKPTLPHLLRKRKVSSNRSSKSSSGTLHVWRRESTSQLRRPVLGEDHGGPSRPQRPVTGPPTIAGPTDGALPPRHGAVPVGDAVLEDPGGLVVPLQAPPPAGAALLLGSGGPGPLAGPLQGGSASGGHLPPPDGELAAGGTSQQQPARMAAAAVTSRTAPLLQVSAGALLMQHRAGSSLSCPRLACPVDGEPATLQSQSQDSALLSGDQLDWSLAEVVFQPTPEEVTAAEPAPPRPQSALACLTPQHATDLVAGVLRAVPSLSDRAAGCLSPDPSLWPAAVCLSAAAGVPRSPSCLSACLHSLSHSSLPSLFDLSRHSPAAGASTGSSSPVSEPAADPLPPPATLLSGEGAVETALEQHPTSGLPEPVSLFFNPPGS